MGIFSATTDTDVTFLRVLPTVDVFPLLLRFLRRFIPACLASLLGAVAGYFGGKVDSIIMRSLDIFMSVPDILFTMAVVYALGASFTNLIIALTLAYFTNYVRLVRSEVLTLSEQDYVEAAKAGGSSGFRIHSLTYYPQCNWRYYCQHHVEHRKNYYL